MNGLSKPTLENHYKNNQQPILQLEDLDLGYGKTKVIHDISLFVKPLTITTVVGANGAGKSTILKAVSGILKPMKGKIIFDGLEVAGKSPDQIVQLGISQVPEGRKLFLTMTVKENLELGAYLCKDPRIIQQNFDMVLEMFPDLYGKLQQKAKTLSGGQQQMLAVGRALMANPKLLLLDEPSIGLAPTVVQTIAENIKKINKSGVGILLVEQNAQLALSMSDDAFILENGRVVKAGPANEIAQDNDVKQAYMGI